MLQVRASFELRRWRLSGSVSLYFLTYRTTELDIVSQRASVQLEREQLDHVLAVDPHHEAAGVPRLEGGGHDHVAPGRQLEPGIFIVTAELKGINGQRNSSLLSQRISRDRTWRTPPGS